MTKCELNAYGKINLGLDVTGRLPNGYHLVKMIMQSVSLCDTLTFEVNDSGEVELVSDRTNIPLGEDNLIYKAIMLVKNKYGIEKGVRVDIKKRLPVAAGMAGGSSDAAASLKAMNQLFNLGLSEKELAELGVKLGADVPYCLMGGTALAEGIGEVLTPMTGMPACSILLVKPDISISTPHVYKELDSLSGYAHPDIDGLIAALKSGDLEKLCSLMGNVLEEVSCREYPEIVKIRDRMKDLGALGAMMSGSGPTVFGIFTEDKTAQEAYAYFSDNRIGEGVFLVKPQG